MVAPVVGNRVQSESGDLGAVLFDLDGLLIDSAALYQRAWTAAAGKFGYDLGEDFYFRALYGRHLDDYADELKQHFGAGFPLCDFAACCDDMVSKLARVDGVPVKKGARELLQWLKEAAIPCALATGSGRVNALRLLNSTRLGVYFDEIVCREDVHRGKPDPEVFVVAAARLNTGPRFCVVLEDSSQGVLAAQRAGMRVIMVPDRRTTDPDPAPADLTIVDSLEEARICLERMSYDAT